jgi:hypothetical protein
MKTKNAQQWIESEVPEPHKSNMLRLLRNPNIGPKLDGQGFLTFTGAMTNIISLTLTAYGDDIAPDVLKYLRKLLEQGHPSKGPEKRNWDFSDEAVRVKEPEPVIATTHTDEQSGASQCKTILNHMTTVGPITQLEATERYRITRLAPRISDLKRAGHKIGRELVSTGRFGRYAKYFIEKEGA